MNKISKLLCLIKTNIILFFKLIFHLGYIKYSFFTMIGKNCLIKTSNKGRLFLGKNVTLNNNVELNSNGGKIYLEGNNYINSNTIIASHKLIQIGKNTTIGPNVLIYDHDHDYLNKKKGTFISDSVIIGKNVWIGGGCIILKGVEIGDNSVIAAGSVITKSIEKDSIVYQKKENSIKRIG